MVTTPRTSGVKMAVKSISCFEIALTAVLSPLLLSVTTATLAVLDRQKENIWKERGGIV